MIWEIVASCVVVVWVGLLLRGYWLGENNLPYFDHSDPDFVPYDWETETDPDK